MRNAHPKPPFGRQLPSRMTNTLIAGKISLLAHISVNISTPAVERTCAKSPVGRSLQGYTVRFAASRTIFSWFLSAAILI